MSVITSVQTFLEAARICTAMQTNQDLEHRISRWLAYYRSLQRALGHYRQAHTAYRHARQRYQPQQEGRWHGTSPRATATRYELAQIHDLYRALQCEGESFYTLAISVLDSIADTLQCYFGLSWDRSAATHARLTRDFPSLCTAKALVLTPTALPTLMPDVHACIVESRAHLTSMTEARYLMACLTALDTYSAAMLHFLARNREKSILAGPWLMGDAPSALSIDTLFPPSTDLHKLTAPGHPVLP